MSSPQAVSSNDFRKALGTFTTGVTVVTTKGEDGCDIGLTANSFNSVSLDPPMVLWSLARSSLSINAFLAARHFAVHVLSSEQQEISQRFARRGIDKFSSLELERGPDNIPLLSECAARFICETTYHYEGGDHIIFVGTVRRFEQWDKPPLLFHGGQYGRLVKPDSTQDSSDLSDVFLGHLLLRCFRKVYAPVRGEFEKRGISPAQYYVLAQAAQLEFPRMTSLQKANEMSNRKPSGSDMDVLFERGWIERKDHTLHLTPKGKQFYIELSSIIKAAESDAESVLDYDLRQTFKLVLLKLLDIETSAHLQAPKEPTLDRLCRDALTRNPEQPALEYGGRWYTWCDLRQVGDGVAAAIEAFGEGVLSVAFVARNRPSSIAGFLGLMANRCSIRMLYPFLSPEIITRELDKIKPTLFVASEEDFSPALLSALEARRISAIALGEMNARTVFRFEEGKASDVLRSEVRILTSGTTGTPKEFPLSYEMIARHLVGASGQQNNVQVVPPVLMFPVSNISGIYSTLPPLLKGQGAVLLERFTVAGWRDYVVRYRPQFTGLPPAGIQMLLDADVPHDDLKSIRAIGTGAAPLDPAVQKAFEDRYGIPILFSYGATEFGGPIVAMTLDLHSEWGGRKFGSVGRPMPGVSLRVIDVESGSVLPPGNDGILEVISPRIGTDWIRTSDLAVIDDDGFMFLLGRADGAIMRGGFKLLPAPIEHALLLHSGVSAAAVVGVKDRRLGEVPVAAIQLKPEVASVSVAELEEHLRRHVPATHIPVHWRIVECLPRTPSMKVDQMAVKSLFAGEAAKSA
jgi:acyl-CoA synthetase (AMP-forming)/AMP-acid ligase II/flavin reductase (DIM6/NTAB) family NADH-FMN oxidoreductase RutF